jgi:uncharacterized membrane protein
VGFLLRRNLVRVRGILAKVNVETIESALKHRILNVELSTLTVVVVIAVYTVIFSVFTIGKNYGFRTYAWDLGIFNQALWTTVHDGRFFYYTPELLINPSGSFFGIHMSPILLLVLPCYAVLPVPQLLLAIQSFVLALGVVPLYKLAKDVSGYRVTSLTVVFVYLLYPPLQGINWFDFHVQMFLPLFFFSAFYFLEKKSWKGYFLFVALSLMVEEHASIVVAFIGFFGLWQQRKQIVSLIRTRNFKGAVFNVPVATIILSVVWYLLVLRIRDLLFPINPDFTFEFKAAANWSILGVQDPAMIPLYIFLYPIRAVAALSYDFLAKLGYILILFAPLAFRPFYRPKYILPALPWFVFALFSNYPHYYGVFNQYPAYVISFVFIAGVYSIDKAGSSVKAIKRSLGLVVVCSLVAFIAVSPLSPVVSIVYPEHGRTPVTWHEELIHEVLKYVPQNAAVMTQSNIFPHVSSRTNAYVIPVIHQIWSGKSAAFEAFAKETLEKVEYLLVDFKSDPYAGRLMFSLIQQSNRFKVFTAADSIILFKKDYDDQAKLLAPYYTTYNYSNLALYSGEIVEDHNSTSGSVMLFNASSGPSPMFWYGPRNLIPPGEYNITMWLRASITNATGNELFTVELCSDSGRKILDARTILDSAFLQETTWTNQTFHLTLDGPLIDFEVRAVDVSNEADIYLDYIEVKQTS